MHVELLCLHILLTISCFFINTKIVTMGEDLLAKVQTRFPKTTARSRFGPQRKESFRVGSESLHSRRPFWARRRANDTDKGERERGRRTWGGSRGTEKTMATYDPFLARSFIHLLTLLSRFYSLSSLCAFNLPGGRQMFAPLPLDRTTHLSPVLPTSPPSCL